MSMGSAPGGIPSLGLIDIGIIMLCLWETCQGGRRFGMIECG
jgi:hypothetical protein